MENENYTGPTGDSTLGNQKGDNTAHMNLTNDETKVKFTNSNNDARIEDGRSNGDAKVDIENVQVAFAGMGKEELMKFANDPFWVRLRWFLFILFWLAWLAMLVGAIVVIVLAPRCKPLPSLDWWQKTVIYQIYPESYQDSNDDGKGDIKGIEERLDYISDLGVNAIWLNPIFESPMKDGGYDVSNYTEIGKDFGTMAEFDDLISKAKEKKLRVILDFVPNHSSNENEWFQKSRERIDPYTDYYVWRAGVPGTPPNNWLSVFGGSAWTYDEVRKQYYLHQFLPEQPDLNLRSENVKEELKNVMKFWLDRGVSGFRVDAVAHLYEGIDFQNEPPADNPKPVDKDDYKYLSHIHTTSQLETLTLIKEWRSFLDEYSKENDVEAKVLLVESYEPVSEVMRYYGNSTEKGANFPFNFQLVENLNNQTNSSSFEKLIRNWLGELTNGSWPNWVLGNHDVKRIASRIDPRLVDGMHMTTMLLTGTPVTYYGEEIGMTDNMDITFAETKDGFALLHEEKFKEYSRDPARTPMQWENKTNAGFSGASKTWLPVNSNYEEINVKAQEADARSHLNIYKNLIKLREQHAIIYGSVSFLNLDEDVFGFSRVKKGSPGYVVLINFGSSKVSLNLAGKDAPSPVNYVGDEIEDDVKYKFPEDGTIEIKSAESSDTSLLPDGGTKGKVRLALVPLEPKEAMLIKFVPIFSG